MKVAVVAEFYPRAADPVLGVWAHRQALAARDAGAEVRVLVLHRPIPPMASLRSGPRGAVRAAVPLLRQPRHAELDGLDVEYVPFVAPPRPGHYGRWATWASPSLRLALARLRKRFPYDLVHAHNAVPAGEAVRRTRSRAPLVVSVHGGDVFHTALKPVGAAAVRGAFSAARLVLANSAGIERRCRVLGAPRTAVVHLGTDLPVAGEPRYDAPTVVTVAHLVARKRHADVLRALWYLRDRVPEARYLVIGDGPERSALEQLAAGLRLADRVEFTGQLEHEEALLRARRAHVFAMPSVDEAFGVAYVEAMAAGLPAIGALGEPGPADIRASGPGMVLVPPGDVEALARQLEVLLHDPTLRRSVGAQARATVRTAYSWERCGAETVAAYEEALRLP